MNTFLCSQSVSNKDSGTLVFEEYMIRTQGQIIEPILGRMVHINMCPKMSAF